MISLLNVAQKVVVIFSLFFNIAHLSPLFYVDIGCLIFVVQMEKQVMHSCCMDNINKLYLC